MVASLTYHDCIGLMPAWSTHDLTIEPLTGGITNVLYRVTLETGKAYVVRIYGAKTEMFIDRDIEAETIRRLQGSAVTPRMVKYLPERGVTIVEFIPGSPLKNADFHILEKLPTFIRPIKLIHSSGVVLPRVFEPIVEVRKLHGLLAGLGREFPEFAIARTVQALERLAETVCIPRADYVPCHNDLLADNFILVSDLKMHPEPMFLIDWEYGGMNSPYYDLGDMFEELLVPPEVELEILRVYWGERCLDEHVFRTYAHKPFADIYWFLWSLIQLCVSNIEFDYYTYGKDKYENAQRCLQTLRETHGVRT